MDVGLSPLPYSRADECGEQDHLAQWKNQEDQRLRIARGDPLARPCDPRQDSEGHQP